MILYKDDWNGWLKISAIAFLICTPLGVLVQYGPRTETARLVFISIASLSGVYLFTEVIISRKCLKNMIRLFLYPLIYPFWIVNSVAIGRGWVASLESSAAKNGAYTAQEGIKQLLVAVPNSFRQMLVEMDFTIFEIDWPHLLIGVAMSFAALKVIWHVPGAISDMQINRRLKREGRPPVKLHKAAAS